MKRNKLVLAITGIAAVGLAVFTTSSFRSNGGSKYHLSAETELNEINGGEEDARGAIDWLYRVRRNQVTGQVNANDVMNAAARANQTISAARNNSQMQTATVNWTELGPDNVGGRTRAVHFDVLDNTHQHMWAGGVGGGLWESNDGANNWHRCAGFFNVAGVYITVVTIAQGSDGALYVGTGEGDFYGAFSNGAGGLLGGGIYKSTDDGVTWSQLSSTTPSPSNSSSAAWVSVNKIIVDPTNPLKIYAGNNKTLKISTDGGASWATAPNVPTTSGCTDVDIASNGTIIATCGNKPWVSTDGGASFTNQGMSANGWLTTAVARTEIAIAPSDPSIVYAFCAGNVNFQNPMAGMLVSVDGGMNWTIVTGAGNAQFDPFNQSQGDYDNIVAVDPSNSHRAIFGGVELWEWTMSSTNPPSGTWNRIALEFPASAFNPWYVHSDKHAIVFEPGNPSTFFIGTDGGIFRTLNGGSTYQPMNKGYNVTQCYSVAPDMWDMDWALAGCQDNGTQYIDGLGNDTADASAVGGGDGGEVDISFLNKNAIFTTVYYGSLARSNNRGGSSASFYCDSRLDNAGQGGFGNFVTPIRLWESNNDLLSGDTVKIINGTYTNSSTITDGSTQTFAGTLTVPVNATPVGSIVTTGVLAICGQDTAISTGGVFSGDATGTINSSGVYTLTWNTTPAANQIVIFEYTASFSIGTVFVVNSNVQGYSLSYTTAVTVNPGDTVKIQDVIQSHIAVGFTTSGSSADHGVWITRRAIDFSVCPLWIKIGGFHSTPSAYSGEASKMAWSPNGDILYVATSGGTLYRFSNIGSVTDSANGDVDHGSAANPSCQVSCRLIGNWVNRFICGLDVDPNDAGHVIVTLGNYSNTSYVYVSTAADTASSIANSQWSDKTGNLDNLGGCPVYSVSFDKYTPNRVLAGTEHGVYECANIGSGSPTWAAAMNGLDNVAVFMIRQQRWEAWQGVPNAGCFYLGTHGRGMWVDKSSWQIPNGISENHNPGSSSSTVINNKDLKVYPNPVIDNAFVNVELAKGGDIDVQIFDLNGKLLFKEKHENMNAGINNVQFGTDGLTPGTYLVVIMQNGKRVGTGRFLKM